MTETPEQVLARLERDVDSLRRRGFGAEADRLATLAAEFRAALEPIALVPEHKAMVRSGKTRRWLRERHADWERVGAASIDERGERTYRLCVLPSVAAIAAGEAEAERILKAVA